MTSSKMRKYLPKTISKIGVNWPGIWKIGHSGDGHVFLPDGETFTSMVEHAAAQGISEIRMWLDGGDHGSWAPGFEVRPGEFNWAADVIHRNANGDVTSPLYSKTDPVPGESSIKAIFDECALNEIKVMVELSSWRYLMDDWSFHPYRLNRLNAKGNVEALGAPGWLTAWGQVFSDAAAKAAFKGRIDAFLDRFGDHDALYIVGLGNELMFAGSSVVQADFFNWIEEMSRYIWDSYGSHKPFIGISSAMTPWSESANRAFEHLRGGARVASWHNYGIGGIDSPVTLAHIQSFFDDVRGEFGTYEHEGETKKYFIRVGENWGFGANREPVNDAVVDINIQGDPIARTYAYELPEVTDTVAPYPHERMYAFLVMALDPTASYSRWGSIIDGIQWSPPSYKRCAEIMKVAKDFYDRALFHELDMVQHKSNVSSSGLLDFKAALLLPNKCLTFVLVGSGSQTVDFGAPGGWRLTTYRWEGDGADNPERVIDDQYVDASAVAMNFGDYTDGFCPGFLMKITNPSRKATRGTMRGVSRGIA